MPWNTYICGGFWRASGVWFLQIVAGRKVETRRDLKNAIETGRWSALVSSINYG